MEKIVSIRHSLPLVSAVVLALGMTSCASLMGNHYSHHCTHTGPCICENMTQAEYEYALQCLRSLTPKEDNTVDSLIQELLAKDYALVQYTPEERKRLVWIDDTVTETPGDLLQYFKSNSGRVMPRDVTTDNTENGIYFYFNENPDGTPEKLRLRVQYYADDPLRFEKLHFIIDGFDYYFTPTNIQRGKGKGIMIWENSDDVLTSQDKDLVYALTHCEWAQLKIIGADGMQHVKMISDSQFEDFYNTLQLYRLKGGTL